jgi:hypothetical protein
MSIKRETCRTGAEKVKKGEKAAKTPNRPGYVFDHLFLASDPEGIRSIASGSFVLRMSRWRRPAAQARCFMPLFQFWHRRVLTWQKGGRVTWRDPQGVFSQARGDGLLLRVLPKPTSKP